MMTLKLLSRSHLILMIKIRCDRLNSFSVIIFARHLQQLLRLVKSRTDADNSVYDRFELSPLAAKRLSPFRLIPDTWGLELSVDFGQALAALIVVKGTPSRH